MTPSLSGTVVSPESGIQSSSSVSRPGRRRSAGSPPCRPPPPPRGTHARGTAAARQEKLYFSPSFWFSFIYLFLPPSSSPLTTYFSLLLIHFNLIFLPPSNSPCCQEDGYWNEEDCGPDFCQCWRGWGWVKTCMEPLVFDETLPGCRSVLSRIVKLDQKLFMYSVPTIWIVWIRCRINALLHWMFSQQGKRITLVNTNTKTILLQHYTIWIFELDQGSKRSSPR